MYRFLIFAVSVLIISTSSAVSLSNTPLKELASRQKGEIVLRNTSIGGLKIGMSEKEVLRKLGTPQTRQVAPNLCTGTDDITLKYHHLTLYLEGGSNKTSKSYLFAITTTNSHYATNQGMRVGDLMSKAEQAYSKAAKNGEKGLYLSLADAKQNECALTFYSGTSKTVTEINLTCAIC